MELKFTTETILPALSQVAMVVNQKTSLPILADVLFDCRKDNIVLTTSDSEIWLSIAVSNVTCEQEARFCVNAQDILRALKNLDNKEVSILLDEPSHTITCDYGNGRFKMPFNDAKDFPIASHNMDDAKERFIDSKRILAALDKVGFSTANEDLRPIMNGIHFDFFPDGLVCVATDGCKLTKYCDKMITHNGIEGNVPTFTLPKKPSNILSSILSNTVNEVRLCFNGRAATFSNRDFKLVTSLLEGRYPNYNSVIPKESKYTVTISKDNITQAIKRVMPMGNANSELLSMCFKKGWVEISAEDVDFAKSAHESVSCDYDIEDSLSIGFKGSVLLDMFRNIDDDYVVIELLAPTRPVVIYSQSTPKDEYLSLVMPMQLN